MTRHARRKAAGEPATCEVRWANFLKRSRPPAFPSALLITLCRQFKRAGSHCNPCEGDVDLSERLATLRRDAAPLEHRTRQTAIKWAGHLYFTRHQLSGGVRRIAFDIRLVF